MADGRIHDWMSIDIGGVAFASKRVRSWDELLDSYRNSFSLPKRLSQDAKPEHKWIFRAEKKKTSEKGKDIDCTFCSAASARHCRSSTVAFLTSLEKALRASDIETRDDRQKWEEDIIRAFKRRAHHYESQIPNGADILEWLALIQHYFGPIGLYVFLFCRVLLCD